MFDIVSKPGYDEFLLLCTDGVWEFISSQEGVDIICNTQKENSPQESAEILAKESWDRWTKHMMGQVVDDITALVIILR